jgi:hypothetical protein
MCAGLLAKHLFSFKFIFLSDGLTAAVKQDTCFADIYAAASWSYSTTMDKRRAARFERGIAWTFACNTHQTEESGEFKSGEYHGQSEGNTNSANSHRVVLVA